MAEWALRGYVLDSEEEEDLLSEKSDGQKPSPQPESRKASFNTNDAVESVDESRQESKCVLTWEEKQAQNVSACNSSARRGAGSVDENKSSEGFWDILSSSQETDKLQDGHHRTQLSRRLRPTNFKTFSASLSKQKGLGTPEPSSSPLTTQSSSSPRLELIPHNPTARTENSIERTQPEEFEGRFPSSLGDNEQRNASDHPEKNNARPTRSLRQRNPIQLHPYAIEGEKYRQVCKARGFKPLRIAQGESQAGRDLLDDSQAEEFVANPDLPEDLPNAAFSQPSLSAADPHDSPDSPSNSTFNTLDLDEEDLPDIDTALRPMLPRIAPNGYKRRKIMHPMVEKAQGVNSYNNYPRSEQSYARAAAGADTEASGLPNFPLASRLQSRGFRYPRAISPIGLPTPITSSEPRQGPPQISECSHSDGNSSTSGGSESEDGILTERSEKAQNSRLGGMERKIRGVLPASWLKLDLRTQKRNSNSRIKFPEAFSPKKDITHQRGVARPLQPTRKTQTTSNNTITMNGSSSQSSSADEGMGLSTPLPSSDLPRFPAVTVISDEEDMRSAEDFQGEVIEDNHVDAMLSRKARRRDYGRIKSALSSRKKQTRLTDLQIPQPRSKARALHSKRRSQSIHQASVQARSGQPRKQRLRAPNLSLLDIPSLGISSNENAPSFIRLAQRTSRLRKDRGESRPGHKYLRLATEPETEDVNESLHSWRNGTLKPKTPQPAVIPSGTGFRSPLSPCSGNQRNAQNSHEGATQSLTSKVPYAAERQSANRMPKSFKPRSIQSSLNKLLCKTSERQNQEKFKKPRQPKNVSNDSASLKRLSRAGHLLASLKESGHSRPAMLESLQANDGQKHQRATFYHRLHGPTQSTVLSNPLLAKFLDDPDILPLTRSIDEQQEDGAPAVKPVLSHKRRNTRKRKPRRLHTDSFKVSDADQPPYHHHDSSHIVISAQADTRNATFLAGLGPSGTTYTNSFDIHPLAAGTCFGEQTFIGSGDFANSFVTGDLDRVRGYFVFQHGPTTFRWGPWEDHTSTQLNLVLHEACEAFHRFPQEDYGASRSILDNTTGLLRETIRYVSSHLSFHDMIDRVAFLQCCKGSSFRLFQALITIRQDDLCSNVQELKPLRIQSLSLCIVFAGQLQQISKHHIVPQALQSDLNSYLQDIVTKALGFVEDEDIASFARLVRDPKQPSGTPVLLDKNYGAVELFVVINHLLAKESSTSGLWEALRATVLHQPTASSKDVRVLECRWEKLFILLPILEIDRNGVLEVSRRHKHTTENWATVKQLLKPVFKVYESKGHTQLPSINSYCRALFGRCLHLINNWGWHRCESVIGTLFDFFACRNLFHLPNEEIHGSPKFLSHLGQKPSLQSTHEDRCFHILLKIIASGLQHMRKEYPGRKIRDIVWRLMPNHGRLLPKDQVIKQTDLDALRNHHDLLCTLYWASPQGFRPPPTSIQDLVDVENSHKEACRINIRALSNLINFQLTTNEPLSKFEPFVNWYTDILAHILRQHRNARTEVEEQVRTAQSTERLVADTALFEATIAQNQRQVEALLSDTLSIMKNAISISPDVETAQALLPVELGSVFALFSAHLPRINAVVIDALEVLSVFATKAMQLDQSTVSVNGEDSQDYGEWPVCEIDNLPALSVPTSAQYLEDHFQAPLRQLLSNCFGADSPPEDALLVKVIGTWVAIGRVLIHGNSKSWADYIEGYGQDAWASLRDTEQTRRWSAYYVAVLIESDRKVLREHNQTVLKAWVASLVERELLLKHQHRLTSSLLNADSDCFILANSPFWATNGHFDITPAEFAERRLSLISNVLSNMRKAVEQHWSRKAFEGTDIKNHCKEILKVMMNTMKSNYQQLGQGSDVRGAYVGFVHRVVELLQQHTLSICPIDRFFTDSSSFPLPANDPTYVVGQLKSYGMRLYDHRTPKQLSVFIQSVSERAAIDGQQVYLVDQLYSAMMASAERKALRGSDLCSFLIKVIFPAYIETSLSTGCGWIMALPILQVSGRVFSSTITDFDGLSEASVASMLNMIKDALGSILRSLSVLVDQRILMEDPKPLKTVAAFFAVVTAALPALDYLCRVAKDFRHTKLMVEHFKSFALFAAQSLLGQPDIETPDVEDIGWTATVTPYCDVQAFALQELRETLSKNWTCHDGQYYVNRGVTRRDVVVDIGLFEEEKAAFLGELETFFHALSRMTVF